jgi:hypothetical protein
MILDRINVGIFMRAISILTVVAAVLTAAPAAQESKPVPKDSIRVLLPGCTKGLIFTAGHRTADQPGSVDIPEGMHLRMNGPKKMMAEIKAHEGSMIEITGLMKRGQFRPDGIGIGGGVRITPGRGPAGGSVSPNTDVNQVVIDVEAWRSIVGNCPTRS